MHGVHGCWGAGLRVTYPSMFKHVPYIQPSHLPTREILESTLSEHKLSFLLRIVGKHAVRNECSRAYSNMITLQRYTIPTNNANILLRVSSNITNGQKLV
jgi:hypothetical protein